MNANEKVIFDHMDNLSNHSKYWMPIIWAGSIVTRARKEGRIRDDFAVKTIMDTLNSFRSGCGRLLSYDWLSLPLVYTQVRSNVLKKLKLSLFIIIHQCRCCIFLLLFFHIDKSSFYLILI